MSLFTFFPSSIRFLFSEALEIFDLYPYVFYLSSVLWRLKFIVQGYALLC